MLARYATIVTISVVSLYFVSMLVQQYIPAESTFYSVLERTGTVLSTASLMWNIQNWLRGKFLMKIK
ncbi:hypothetical protein NVIE_009040 [Nitrososphaera viennensis EN76]|uniref:Uncharacterized protein n=1 Tax=Nitrososphaera viennensis EN76 TaxID=926571 RepID=A0A060HEN4_9ARCH|nr:hypothetical protein NVIE_009040 [Nitrososphaera viennensis EN76]